MMDGSINPQGGRLETPLIIGKLFDVCSVVYIRLTVVLLFSFIASYTGDQELVLRYSDSGLSVLIGYSLSRVKIRYTSLPVSVFIVDIIANLVG